MNSVRAWAGSIGVLSQVLVSGRKEWMEKGSAIATKYRLGDTLTATKI